MKWTDHSKLEAAYGIRIIGWPPSVPFRNPSSLSVAQNRQVLEALHDRTMRFERVAQTSGFHRDTPSSDATNNDAGATADEIMDISWAYQDPDEPVEPVSPRFSLDTLPA